MGGGGERWSRILYSRWYALELGSLLHDFEIIEYSEQGWGCTWTNDTLGIQSWALYGKFRGKRSALAKEKTRRSSATWEWDWWPEVTALALISGKKDMRTHVLWEIFRLLLTASAELLKGVFPSTLMSSASIFLYNSQDVTSTVWKIANTRTKVWRVGLVSTVCSDLTVKIASLPRYLPVTTVWYLDLLAGKDQLRSRDRNIIFPQRVWFGDPSSELPRSRWGGLTVTHQIFTVVGGMSTKYHLKS